MTTAKNHKKANKPAKVVKHAQPKKVARAGMRIRRAVARKAVERPSAQGKRDGDANPKVRAKVNANVYPPEEVRRVLEDLARNDAAVGYLKKNVSKHALDVMTLLASPKTDEGIAAELDMKINAVRRILNIMQGYGITNYYVSKNVNGWLSFAWYVNVSKLKPFLEYITSMENKKPIISNNCNDYFMCDNCYSKTRLIFTFDAAFEENFKCGACGDGLIMIDRAGAASLIQKENDAAKALKISTEDKLRPGPT